MLLKKNIRKSDYSIMIRYNNIHELTVREIFFNFSTDNTYIDNYLYIDNEGYNIGEINRDGQKIYKYFYVKDISQGLFIKHGIDYLLNAIRKNNIFYRW